MVILFIVLKLKSNLLTSAVLYRTSPVRLLPAALKLSSVFLQMNILFQVCRFSVERAALTSVQQKHCGGATDGEAACWSLQKQSEELAHIYSNVCQLFPQHRQL